MIDDDPRRRGTPDFDDELDQQAARLLVPGAVFLALVWLPFVPNDRLLHPDVPALVGLRLGLSVVSIIVLALHFFGRDLLRPQGRLLLLVGYMQLASGLVAGLSGAEPAYVGGWLVNAMIAPAVPLSRSRAFGSVAASLVAFFVASVVSGSPLLDGSHRYTLTNVAATAAGVPFLVVMLDRVRRRSWEKSVQIEAQRRELATDKARIDELLHNILPAPIVTELKATDRVAPRHHGEVTVLFTDFVGFSSIAERIGAEELVADLDACFSTFDAIVARRGLAKHNTIGESYMAAAGVPTARRTHAADAVLAGLDMARALAERAQARSAAGRPTWEVRIGLHTGPLVAGVVGQTRFAYDVWGDTVNLASRMESSGAPGRVNLSAVTAARVRDLFVLEARGQVPAKNKGMVDMFFVHGIRPELSIDGAGVEPNDAFWARARG